MVSINIYDHANEFAQHLDTKRATIHKLLRKYQSYEVVEDEIEKSIEALTHLSVISSYYDEITLTSKISVFLPLNLPLYSLVLFAIMPSYQSNSIVVRAPDRMKALFAEIETELALSEYYPSITIFNGTRGDFLEKHCKKSSVVIFTGKHQNFQKIRKQCNNNTLFLFNGVGYNPIVVTESANVELAVNKTAYVKLFNNGQDCAGPDCILVHSLIADEFVEKLKVILRKTPIDNSYKNTGTVVGPLFEPSSLTNVLDFILSKQREGAKVTHGGKIDMKHMVVYPCIVESTLINLRNFDELYSPLFLILRYTTDQELALYFNDVHNRYQNREMYISLFGESSVVKNISGSIIIKDKTIHDVERGVEEYGGYSPEASSVSYRGLVVYKPLLIPREIKNFLSPTGWLSDILLHLPKSSVNKEYSIISKEFEKVVQCIFGEELLFAYIFGSFAMQKDKRCSDIDTFICVRNRNNKDVEKYLQWLFLVHEFFGRIPDFKYPAEIVTFSELEKASQEIQTITLSATKNEVSKYDALVWFHSLSQKNIGTVFPENIPTQWEKYFPIHSSRLLLSFLSDLDDVILRIKNVPPYARQLHDLPRSEPSLSQYIRNLNKQGLVKLLKMIPFDDAPQYTDIVLRLVSERHFMGGSLFDSDNPDQLYNPYFRFGVVAKNET